jgi:hypothetical protein
MFVVYWTESVKSEDGAIIRTPRSHEEESLTEAMAFMEKMRALEDDLESGIRFLTMTSRQPENVTKPGVSSPSPDYNWTKRRGGRRP